MKVIQKTLKLEQHISRLPSVYPSYLGNSIIYFDESSIVARNMQHKTNYGLLPLNLMVIGIGSESPSLSTSPSAMTLSWYTISEWYSFFTSYYRTINNGGKCGRPYGSLTELYDSEHVSSSLPFGNDRETYVVLDSTFKSMGGIVKEITKECDGNASVSGYEDNGFYKWMQKNIVPSFTIPSEYGDYWNTTTLYYQDVIEWISWFSEMSTKYSSSLNNCAVSNDCCECEEYIHRGGESLLESLKTWLNETNEAILSVSNFVKDNVEKLSPYVHCIISVTNAVFPPSIQESLIEEYSANQDFRHCSYGSNKNTIGGTVVNHDNTVMLLKETPNNGGSKFNHDLMEMEYDTSQFNEYFPINLSANTNEFIIAEDRLKYGFNDEGEKKFGKDEYSIREKFSKMLKLETSELGWVLADGELLPITSSEYIEVDGKKLIVKRSTDTNTPYVTFGGNDIIAKYDFSTNSYSFTIGEKKSFPRTKGESDLLSVVYNGSELTFDSGSTEVEYGSYGITFPIIDGYCYHNDSTIYVHNGKVYADYVEDYGIMANAVVNDGYVTLRYDGAIDMYDSFVVTGVTSSKLLDLRSYNVMTDDCGNTINGINQSIGSASSYNYQPSEGSVLEPLYQIGNVSSLSQYSGTSGTTPTYVGSIITSMEFYYVDAQGDKIEDTVTASSGSSLEAIYKCDDKKGAYDDGHQNNVASGNIHCNIEYHVGATLYLPDGKYKQYPKGNDGVTYIEDVEFVKEKVEYKMNSNGLSYPIYVYKLVQDSSMTSSFKCNSCIFYSDSTTNVTNNSYTMYSDMAKFNNLDASPTFQNAYNIGVLSIPMIDSDINIDRGNNAAFEKHLKLGEVMSLEALENYTNGYFKFMEN